VLVHLGIVPSPKLASLVKRWETSPELLVTAPFGQEALLQFCGGCGDGCPKRGRCRSDALPLLCLDTHYAAPQGDAIQEGRRRHRQNCFLVYSYVVGRPIATAPLVTMVVHWAVRLPSLP
jgi:hypothetical protein